MADSTPLSSRPPERTDAATRKPVSSSPGADDAPPSAPLPPDPPPLGTAREAPPRPPPEPPAFAAPPTSRTYALPGASGDQAESGVLAKVEAWVRQNETAALAGAFAAGAVIGVGLRR